MLNVEVNYFIRVEVLRRNELSEVSIKALHRPIMICIHIASRCAFRKVRIKSKVQLVTLQCSEIIIV